MKVQVVMSTAEDRALWAREVRRIGNQIAHRRELIRKAKAEIPDLEARRDDLIKRISEDDE